MTARVAPTGRTTTGCNDGTQLGAPTATAPAFVGAGPRACPRRALLPPPHPHSSGQVPVPAPPRAAGGQGRIGQPQEVAPTLAIPRVAGSPRRWRGSPGAGRPLVPTTAASSYNGVNIPMFKCNDSATVRCTVSPASSPLTLAPSHLQPSHLQPSPTPGSSRQCRTPARARSSGEFSRFRRR